MKEKELEIENKQPHMCSKGRKRNALIIAQEL